MIRRGHPLRLFLAGVALTFAGCGGSERAAEGVWCDFEQESDLDRVVWRCRQRFSLSRDHATSGERSLRCDFGTLHYPGIEFPGFPHDVTAVRSLSFDLYSDADAPLELVVRIDDEESGTDYENRYNGSFTLRPGANRVAIPLSDVREGPAGRLLDLSRIDRFLLFLHDPPGPATLHLDAVTFR